MTEYYVGQQLKNSHEDNFPMFEIIKITESLGGLKHFRVKNIDFEQFEFVLHEEDLIPY